MHCQPALRNSHTRADRPVVEQVKCRVHLQHCSTIFQACLLERPTVEPVPNFPVGVSPFLFCPPDGPAAVDYLNTPPATARPSLIQSEIPEGISHQDLSPLAHSRRTLARRRPHLHRGVCVCVCVCNVFLFVFNSILSAILFPPNRLPSSPQYCRGFYPSYTPTYLPLPIPIVADHCSLLSSFLSIGRPCL